MTISCYSRWEQWTTHTLYAPLSQYSDSIRCESSSERRKEPICDKEWKNPSAKWKSILRKIIEIYIRLLVLANDTWSEWRATNAFTRNKMNSCTNYEMEKFVSLPHVEHFAEPTQKLVGKTNRWYLVGNTKTHSCFTSLLSSESDPKSRFTSHSNEME